MKFSKSDFSLSLVECNCCIFLLTHLISTQSKRDSRQWKPGCVTTVIPHLSTLLEAYQPQWHLPDCFGMRFTNQWLQTIFGVGLLTVVTLCRYNRYIIKYNTTMLHLFFSCLYSIQLNSSMKQEQHSHHHCRNGPSSYPSPSSFLLLVRHYPVS